MRTVSRIPVKVYYAQYDGILDAIADLFSAPYEKTVEAAMVLKNKDRIVKAFRSVYGRNPTDQEIYQVVDAYIKNVKNYGKALTDKKFVLEIQKTLNKVLPRKIAEDGIFYYQTVAGIRKFQELRGIRPSGYLNEATILELLKLSDGNSIRQFYDYRFGHKSKVMKYVLVGGIAILGGILIYRLLRRA